jgi:hypothetical protein
MIFCAASSQMRADASAQLWKAKIPWQAKPSARDAEEMQVRVKRITSHGDWSH